MSGNVAAKDGKVEVISWHVIGESQKRPKSLSQCRRYHGRNSGTAQIKTVSEKLLDCFLIEP